VPVCHGKSCNLATDVSGTDESDGRHDSEYRSQSLRRRAA